MPENDSRSARLNMRLSPEAKSDLVQAASLTGQDLTSFVLDAALEKARSVVLETTLVRLSEQQYAQLLNALNQPAEISEKLQELFYRASERTVAN